MNGLTLGALLLNNNKQRRSNPTMTTLARSKATLNVCLCASDQPLFDTIVRMNYKFTIVLLFFTRVVQYYRINIHYLTVIISGAGWWYTFQYAVFAKHAWVQLLNSSIPSESTVWSLKCFSQTTQWFCFGSVNIALNTIWICITLGVSTNHQSTTWNW